MGSREAVVLGKRVVPEQVVGPEQVMGSGQVVVPEQVIGPGQAVVPGKGGPRTRGVLGISYGPRKSDGYWQRNYPNTNKIQNK